MTSICLCFDIHQPLSLQAYDFFRIGQDHAYGDTAKDKETLQQLTDTGYSPANQCLLELIQSSDKRFKVSFSISGISLALMEQYQPGVLSALQSMTNSGCAEMLGTTFYHSLSYSYSAKEFQRQVILHQNKIQELFDIAPSVYRNTEAIYGNDIARTVEELGFRGFLHDGNDSLLMGRSPNYIYQPLGTRRIRALLKNQLLSEGLSVRFSDPTWVEYPLAPTKFVSWLQQIAQKKDSSINLFLDYRVLANPVMRDFLTETVRRVLKTHDLEFRTPSEVFNGYPVKGTYDSPYSANWAESQKDLPAWMENYLQREALERVYQLENAVLATGDQEILRTWSSLQTADYFYHMANSYPSRYDTYINYLNILTDLEQRLPKS